jgi:hypothetical protein
MAQSSGREMNQGHSDNLEDERGIDVSQIRAQLRLSVPERVRTMVAIANQAIAIREYVKQTRPMNQRPTSHYQ